MGKTGPLWGIHDKMMSRCFDETDKDFANYGGRGITVAPELQDVDDYRRWFKNQFGFEKPPAGYTVDRINNDGNYEPGNLRLATYKEQNNNRRSNKVLEFRGERHTISQWSEIVGLPRKTIEKRLSSYGWTVDDALTTPVDAWKKPVQFNGQTKTICEWADDCGISRSTLCARLKKGMTIEEALATPARKWVRKTPD